MRSKTVLVVDDDIDLLPVVCDVLKSKGLHAIGVSDGITAIQVFNNEKPDAVLLDLDMPGMNGVEIMQAIKRIDNNVPVVILTAHGDISMAVKAVKCGAYDFILKPPDFESLVVTIKTAIEMPDDKAAEKSKRFYDMFKKHLSEHIGLQGYDDPKINLYKTLTEREIEILYLTAKGLSSTKIALQLSISPRTVETHRTNLMRKLGLNNKSEIILFALKKNILL
ncbi:MAG: hypothetical protein A2X59_06975 [Nitrospirae bacterium GWC2_42_7]|nr:MAG: hypothetical protein A2X59_06975 [Nitrospirae bacterium GWC2_42_7]